MSKGKKVLSLDEAWEKLKFQKSIPYATRKTYERRYKKGQLTNAQRARILVKNGFNVIGFQEPQPVEEDGKESTAKAD